MVPKDDYSAPSESRPPTLDDLVKICRRLNELGARYIVVGGFAVIQHGFPRATQDIDLLIESSLENQTLVKKGLECLPDKAVLELGDDDLREWTVVRVGDEVLVDLMMFACGINYADAKSEIQTIQVYNTLIPFASPKLLLRMKQTYREKDHEDRLFLQRMLKDGAL